MDGDLIRRGAVLERMDEVMGTSDCPTEDMIDAAKNALAVDAAQVVRCRECVYFKTDDSGKTYCQIWDAFWDANGFCYAGARMDAQTDGQTGEGER